MLRVSGQLRERFEDQELVVIPSLLSAHPIIAQLDDPGDATIAVASGARPLDHMPPPTHRGSLLGHTRTAILGALDTPSTTRDLARHLGLSEATVSHHLHALSRSGLATSSRQGRWVLYALTPLGRRVLCRVA
jgi:DNA-binding transcriptional ArsR family regulator